MEIVRIQAKDFCCFEELDLPVANNGLVWVSGVNGDSDAASSNGSGKSTIFKCLVWCLYNNTIDGERGDNVIRAGAKSTTVSVTLSDGSREWIVTRTRKKGTGTLALVVPGGEEFKASAKETQCKIIDLLGLDFLAFRNTVLYGQNDINRFTHGRTTDAERKEMLHCILRTNIFTACRDLVREDKKRIEGEVSELEHEQGQLDARLYEYDLEALEANVTAWDRNRDALVQEREGRLEKLAENVAIAQGAYDETVVGQEELERRKQSVQDCEVQIKSIQANIDALNEATNKKLDECDNKRTTLSKKRSEVSEIVAKHRAKLDVIGESVRKLDGDQCPVCNTSLSSDGVESYRNELFTDMEAADDKCEKAKQLVCRIDKKLGEVDADCAHLRQRPLELDAWAREQHDWQRQIDEANEQARDDETRRLAAWHNMEMARTKLESAQEDAPEQEQNPYTEQLEDAKEKTAKYSKDIKTLEKKIKKARTELSYAEFWNKGFSNQGVSSYMLDSVMPYITDRANYYLDILSDGDIQVLFSTQKALKSSKEYRDKIDISWKIEGQQVSYPPSGGQAKKIEIATDLALMDLVSYREGHNTNILILDEVLDGLDDVGRQRVLQLLKEVNKFRSSIFVISHEAMSEAFENYITVEKNDGVSTIKEMSLP